MGICLTCKYYSFLLGGNCNFTKGDLLKGKQDYPEKCNYYEYKRSTIKDSANILLSS